MAIRDTSNDNVFDKFITAAMPHGSGIEAQEAQGQHELVRSSQLPSEGIDQAEQIGVKVIGPTAGDPLFCDVELPAGWSKQRTDHSMWSDLVDDKGRIRGGIFYKAAFYDRKAFFSANARYHAKHTYPDDHAEPSYGIIIDGSTAIWRSGPFVPTDPTDSKTYYEARRAAQKAAEEKIAEMFPNYRDVTAYWGEQ